MLRDVFRDLDSWISRQNIEARLHGLRSIKRCEFHVVGQTALFESKIQLEMTATSDVDVINNAEYAVLAELDRLLSALGMHLDKLPGQIWMPDETLYVEIFQGEYVTAFRAQPEFIMISKAKKAFAKNKLLLRQYIASNPPQIFFDLCQKYKIDLTAVLKD